MEALMLMMMVAMISIVNLSESSIILILRPSGTCTDISGFDRIETQVKV